MQEAVPSPSETASAVTGASSPVSVPDPAQAGPQPALRLYYKLLSCILLALLPPAADKLCAFKRA